VVDDGMTEADGAGVTLVPLREQLSEVERQVLSAALQRLHWNRAEVARQLKISYPTLLQKIKTYRLRPTS
jgi:DNA-binding NtrC family response regulator